MTTATGRLTDCLPKDPTNDGPIGVDSTGLRAVLAELNRIKTGLAHHLDAGSDPCQDRGVEWPCDVAEAIAEPRDTP